MQLKLEQFLENVHSAKLQDAAGDQWWAYSIHRRVPSAVVAKFVRSYKTFETCNACGHRDYRGPCTHFVEKTFFFDPRDTFVEIEPGVYVMCNERMFWFIVDSSGTKVSGPDADQAGNYESYSDAVCDAKKIVEKHTDITYALHVVHAHAIVRRSQVVVESLRS